jgi:hypothetical protein
VIGSSGDLVNNHKTRIEMRNWDLGLSVFEFRWQLLAHPITGSPDHPMGSFTGSSDLPIPHIS